MAMLRSILQERHDAALFSSVAPFKCQRLRHWTKDEPNNATKLPALLQSISQPSRLVGEAMSVCR